MGVFSCGCNLGVFVCMYKHNRRCVSVGLVFVRVFVSVFVGVFVWVGFCITQFNLERMLQLWIDVLDLIKHRSASQTYHKGHTISDLHMCKNE